MSISKTPCTVSVMHNTQCHVIRKKEEEGREWGLEHSIQMTVFFFLHNHFINTC